MAAANTSSDADDGKGGDTAMADAGDTDTGAPDSTIERNPSSSAKRTRKAKNKPPIIEGTLSEDDFMLHRSFKGPSPNAMLFPGHPPPNVDPSSLEDGFRLDDRAISL